MGEGEERPPPTGHPLHGSLQGTYLAEDHHGQNDGELSGEMPWIFRIDVIYGFVLICNGSLSPSPPLSLSLSLFLSFLLSLPLSLSPLPPPQIMDPTQPKRSLLSSVYSSVASIVGQDGGPPSIFNAVVSEPCFIESSKS